ncbi:response regulator transcription factor [Clostridium beijerinckii]|jgi:DNA-binding response OmpR family regulator|uniref:Stage 0 sporulation protein A homolog n=2 Tax=Clostridium beijerinckii TaxID=1520 RepID=A0AAE2RQ61_CLOBE|nr:response regulator transcription factor [Clostridium beijerinckii]ABR35892.1 two component transcriptional regulator, winged helix family [Clostridium beijerinckii NCIMB 8052]AIU03744.1 two component transcriptional regulator [Clostridium beijerinckii ATCC 35702]MBF7809473.1 response regulator transcription factor [Clostridium beijerinckii]NRT23068.1 DNA-binding response OmpR family regulator [Clostridium beijerinckii]NRT69772.1 DNA-binding response OmpR family regulator [Clostridium beijer
MEKKKSILVVDDEKDIREVIEIYLINEEFEVITACDGLEALEKLKNEAIDLIILDIMMPKLDGIRTCLKIREEKKMPIIMLSAKSEDSDKILGLNIGADDYVVKPFNPLELVARVKSQIRRTTSFNEPREENDDEICIDGLVINTANREVFVDDKFVRLTPREFEILKVLATNIGRVLSTEQIYENVWDEPFFNSDNTVAVHIRNIREKIEINPKEPKYIKLVWGVGYKIDK